MIPVAEPCLNEQDIENAIACLKSGWISSAGDNIPAFETRWAEYCQKRHGIAVFNGTVALEMAIKLLDLAPGDEVIMPSFTIISCAQAVTKNGGVPVLVDQEEIFWQMDVQQIESKITEKTRAIMVVHIYGHPVDMDPILELCRRYDLKLIEDAAETHGALYKGRPCGSFGDISTFSFFANKLITTGEGGMVLVNCDELAAKARSLRNLCFQPRRFFHEEIGDNFRMTNLQAAIGLNQVERIETIVRRKREIAANYQELLGALPGIRLQQDAPYARNVYWIFGILLDQQYGDDCLWLTEYLKEQGIETRPFFLGMHEQPVLKRMGLFSGETYPVAEMLARRGFYIPSGLTIGDEQQKYIADILKAGLAKRDGKYSPVFSHLNRSDEVGYEENNTRKMAIGDQNLIHNAQYEQNLKEQNLVLKDSEKTVYRQTDLEHTNTNSQTQSNQLQNNVERWSTRVYDNRFYDSQKSLSLSSAEVVVPLVCSMLRPSSVVDFGCGVGTWLKVFMEQGVTDAQGLELSTLSDDHYLIPPEKVLTGVNFGSQSLDISGTSDLAVCLEVGEHIDAKFSSILVENLTKTSDLVLFSAAIPGQTGVQHVNEQPLSYWRDLFEERGYQEIDCIRPHIQNVSGVAWWYRQNIVLFASITSIESSAELRELANRYATSSKEQERIAYVSEWVLNRQRSASKHASEILLQIKEQLRAGGDLASAGALLEIVLGLEWKSESLFRELADVYQQLGDKEKAERYAKRVADYLPPVAEAPSNLSVKKMDAQIEEAEATNLTKPVERRADRSEKVSIIIPTHNRAGDLANLLESLCKLNRSDKELEILVVDNNSSDNTKEITEGFIGRLSSLKYIHEPSPGLHAARHRGAQEAENEILAFFDDDVTVSPYWLDGIKESFKDPQVQLATGKIEPAFEAEPPAWLDTLWNKTQSGRALGWLTLLDLGDTAQEIPVGYVWGANFAIRKRALLEAGGFHPDSLPEDLIRFRGDGESGLARKIAEKKGKAVYHPLSKVTHKVARSRLEPEYFYKRGFAQGISDSFSAVRHSGDLQPMKDVPDSLETIDQVIKRGLAEGWNYHQSELRRDNQLMDWVLKESYI